jgi:hypothetical protein
LTAEHIAEAEDVENILDVREARIETAGTRTNPLVSETVICRTLLGIREYGIGLRRFLEFLFSLGVARIFVRVILDREASLGLLDLDVGRGAGDA